MPRRTTTAELRDRIDGLALAFFASMSATQTVLIEMHPGDAGLIGRMRAEAVGMIELLFDMEQEAFPPDALDNAFAAVMGAFVPRVDEEAEEPSNDNDEQ